MVKKNGWFAVLVTCMSSLFTGCSEETIVESGTDTLNKVVLQGSAETKNVSRSALSDKGVFSWSEGDKIDVFASDGCFYEFSLTDGAGTNNGSFQAELPEGTTIGNYAISPAGLSPVFEANGQVSLTLPVEYTIEGQQTHAPMLAKPEGYSLAFKNLGGIMKLPIGNIKDGCRIEVSSETHQLAGSMVITRDTEGNYILEGRDSNSGKLVTLSSTSTNSNQSFYLPIPVTDGKVELNVKVYDAADGGTEKLSKTATLPIRRKELVIMPTLTIPETANAVVKDAASTDALNEALNNAATESTPAEGEKTEVIITVNSNTNLGEEEEASSTVEVTSAITIPTAFTAPETGSTGDGGDTETPGEGEGTEEQTEAPVVKIVFDEVPVATAATDNKIVLTDNQEVTEGETTESKSEVEVAIPEVPEATEGETVEAPSFDISLPTTTVTLKATQETATFNEVWATTADNTLIVAKGVTIKRLYVRSGNIKVTGHVDYIESYSGKTVYVTLSGNGSVGSTSGDIVVEHENDKVDVDFANEAVADGQTIPYEISTIEHLRSLSNRINQNVRDNYDRPYTECNYILTNDIDLGTDQPWTPIGTEANSFAGIFDGNGHTITGIINLGECDNAGFFGRIHRGGTVKNLTIAADMQIIKEGISTSNVVGGFVGNIDGAIFENCHHTGNITINAGHVGGFVGTSTNGTFSLCSNTGNLTNENINGSLGGFIGIDNNSTLTGCYSTGNLTLVETSGTCGGLVGRSYSHVTMTACWTGGTFTAKETGGLFGYVNDCTATACYWSSQIGRIGNGSWNGNKTDVYEGTSPEAVQIQAMSQYIASWGWTYKSDGTLAPLEGNNIPSNPIQPW